MAEALLRELAGDRFEVFSAGAEPAAEVHPLTIAQLRPTLSAIDTLTPKSWLEFAASAAAPMDIIIAMCDEVSEYRAPSFPGQPVYCEWNFADPLADGMSDSERRRAFEQVFRQILRRASLFAALPLHSMAAHDQAQAVNAVASADPSGCVIAP